VEVRLKEKIPGVFWPVHQAIRRGEVTEVVAKGGRGSGKSSYLSMELVWQLLRHPDCHAVVLRKVGGTLRNSVYNQIVWAIGELGCAGYFRCTVSPMECTYLPTGQKILFFGTDDPGKLKSLKLPFGAVGICWFEELDQFDGPEEVRNVEQTVLRGGSWTLTLKSFNPPAMARSWANRYALETRPGKLVHHSTYRDLPRAMLGERFWADAEHLQRTNPAAFRHEYGGEVVGSGAAVFANLQLRAVPDDELERYDRVYYGVDWGWYPDPWAYNAAAYDAARRVLVIFDELTRSRTPNREELALFTPYLLEEILLVQPKMLVTLGNTALHALLGAKSTIGACHGQVLTAHVQTDKRAGDFPLFALYHPASIIYNQKLKDVYQADLERLHGVLASE